MKTKLDRLESDMEAAEARRESDQKQYVTMQHFNAVIEPMQRQLTEVGRDIKKVLMIVSRRPGRTGEDACDT